MNKLHDQFEAWYLGWCSLVTVDFSKRPDGKYESLNVQAGFETWQASNKAALAPVRELVERWQTGDGFNGEDWYGLSKCRDELAKLLEE